MQTRLPLDSRTLLVDTFPNTRVHKSPNNMINIGLEYTARELNANIVHWKERIDPAKYDTIGFNVSYLTYALNVAPFLRRNNIKILREKRKTHKVIVGGPGATNINNALGDIADETYLGEIDGDHQDSRGFSRCKELKSPAVLKGNAAVVEIARGCKHRCAFCEYGHVLGGEYREKEISTVKEQIRACLKKTRNISLRTANLASYSDIEELARFCKGKLTLRWGDIAIMDADNILPYLKDFNIYSPKIGIESFDENTRRRIKKPFSDTYLEEVLKEIFRQCSSIHIYLIYGLPGDNYAAWHKWARRLKELREQQPHPIRIDFSITSFEPCPNTPLSNAPEVDYARREEFLKEWIRTMKSCGFYKDTWDIKAGNDFGRFGRKELTYRMINLIRTGSQDAKDKIAHALPLGVERSLPDSIVNRFLTYRVGTLD